MRFDYDYRNKRVLFISDLHIPFHHPDAFAFLQKLKDSIKPQLVINVGDAVDFHNISFHNSDPDGMSPSSELRLAKRYLKQLEKIFPKMYIVGSNHGDLPLRKAFAHAIPKDMIRPYNDLFGVGKGWKFVDDLTLTNPGKGLPDVYVCHNIRKNALQVAQQRGQRFVCGHYHEAFSIQYSGNPRTLLWAMITGCLINPKSYAFNYNKLNLNRPIIGTGAMINGVPRLYPMILNSEGRWIKQLV